jgi:hypothetical protein
MIVFLFNTVIYVFFIVMSMYSYLRLCIFIVPAGTLRLPWLRFSRAFSSVVRQMPEYNPQRRGTASTLPKFLCCSIYCLFLCRSVYCFYVNLIVVYIICINDARSNKYQNYQASYFSVFHSKIPKRRRMRAYSSLIIHLSLVIRHVIRIIHHLSRLNACTGKVMVAFNLTWTFTEQLLIRCLEFFVYVHDTRG